MQISGVPCFCHMGFSHVEVSSLSSSQLLSWCMCCRYLSSPPHPPSSLQCRPFLSDQPLPSVLAPLHSIPSSFSPHLPVFCALSTLPPALSVSVQPHPLFPLCLPFPLWCCPLTPRPVLPLSLLLTGTPNLLVLLLTAPPLSFFFFWGGGGGGGGVANNCCQQAPTQNPSVIAIVRPTMAYRQ